MNYSLILVCLVAGASLGGVAALFQQLKYLRQQFNRFVMQSAIDEQERSSRTEHLYHSILALARLSLVNPETFKEKINERTENYTYATKLFTEADPGTTPRKGSAKHK